MLTGPEEVLMLENETKQLHTHTYSLLTHDTEAT